MIAMTLFEYTCELVISVKFLLIHLFIFIQHVHQIFILSVYLLKSSCVPVDVLDSEDIALRMEKASALREFPIYGKTASYWVEVMRYRVCSQPWA